MTPPSAAPPAEPSPTRTAADTSPRLAVGALLAGRYRILELLGVGGMGLVYRARDEQLEIDVAVKVLRPDLDHDAGRLERFKQELVLARQVSHANVVRNHDLGRDGELLFLTMDYVPGRSLREVLAEEGRLDVHRTLDVGRQLAAALAAAHEAGVVHRDLKPGNVLIQAGGRAMVSDFGVARSLGGGGRTSPGAVVGTLDYLSPEQARGEPADERADLYALGIVLFEMVTGELPFAGGSDAEILAQRLTGSTRDLSKAAVKVPRRFAALVRRLLEREPSRRPSSAREVLAELERCGTALPRVRRRGVGLVLLGLLLAAGTALWLRRAQGPATRPPVGQPARHALALLPLADETGRPELAWIATGLPEMLGSALAEGPGLRVLDGPRVDLTLASLQLPSRPLSETEARRLAELLDADRLAGGRVRVAGETLRVDLSLIAADLPGAPAEAVSAEVPVGQAFDLVERLGASLRARLEAPPPSGPSVLSRSPAALAAYAAGAASLRRGEALAAAAELEMAVAADPAFSAAWVRLALARDELGHRQEAREAARRAVETLGAGDGRGALEARAVEARLAGEPERAQQLLVQIVERYSDDPEARVALADAFGDEGRLDRAIEALGEATRLAPHHPRAWYLLGKYSILAGNARVAIDDHLVHALVVQNQLGSDEGRAEVYNAFGVAYRNLGDMAHAAESYQQAAAIRRRIGDDRGYATTLRNLANLELMRGAHAAAEGLLKEALAIAERLGDGPGRADLYNDFGVLAEERGDHQEALEHYQRALRERRDLGNDLALAQSYSNVGFACYQLGRYDDALVYWRQGLELARESGDPSGVVLATQNLGLLELARGDWDASVASFLAALTQSRELGMMEATAASLGHLGRLAQYQGRPAAARASYDEALAVLAEIEDQRGLAEFTLARAEVEIELGLGEAAGRSLERAAELLGTATNHEQRAELERLRGEWHLLRGERGPAQAVLPRAVAEAERSHSVVALLGARISAARAELAGGGRGSLARAERLHDEARELGHARSLLAATELLAGASLAADQAEQALGAAGAGLASRAAQGGYGGAYRLHLLKAHALERLGRAAEAAAERRRAREEVERVGRDLDAAARASFESTAEAKEVVDAE